MLGRRLRGWRWGWDGDGDWIEASIRKVVSFVGLVEMVLVLVI